MCFTSASMIVLTFVFAQVFNKLYKLQDDPKSKIQILGIFVLTAGVGCVGFSNYLHNNSGDVKEAEAIASIMGGVLIMIAVVVWSLYMVRFILFNV